MAYLILVVKLICKLCLKKFWFYFIVYFLCLFVNLLLVVKVKNMLAPLLIFSYTNWILFNFFKVDSSLSDGNFYKMLNVPSDYVLFVKVIFVFSLFCPQVFVLIWFYSIDLFHTLLFSGLIFYSLFHIERSARNLLIKITVAICSTILFFIMILIVIILFPKHITVLALSLLLIISLFEYKNISNGKYNRV